MQAAGSRKFTISSIAVRLRTIIEKNRRKDNKMKIRRRRKNVVYSVDLVKDSLKKQKTRKHDWQIMKIHHNMVMLWILHR